MKGLTTLSQIKPTLLAVGRDFLCVPLTTSLASAACILLHVPPAIPVYVQCPVHPCCSILLDHRLCFPTWLTLMLQASTLRNGSLTSKPALTSATMVIPLHYFLCLGTCYPTGH